MSARSSAVSTAIDIAKVIFSSADIKGTPNKETAGSVADFIETLAKRLEPMKDSASYRQETTS